MVTLKEYRNGEKPDWCPGCGDYSVLAGLNKAVVSLGIEPHNLVISAGIGCSGKISGYTRAYGFQGLHGRALPVAQGIKLANKNLTVIAMGGDGDGYAIGVGHFIHAMRRNINITYIVMDNQLYALTKAQASPRSDLGFITSTSLEGATDEPIFPTRLALSMGATFVAQAFTGNMKQMVNIFEQAISHEGFSIVNVFSPCHTYNYKNTPLWFKQHLTNLDNLTDYDISDKYNAYKVIDEYNNLITGVIYINEKKEIFEKKIPGFSENLPISKMNISVKNDIIEKMCDCFR